MKLYIPFNYAIKCECYTFPLRMTNGMITGCWPMHCHRGYTISPAACHLSKTPNCKIWLAQGFQVKGCASVLITTPSDHTSVPGTLGNLVNQLVKRKLVSPSYLLTLHWKSGSKLETTEPTLANSSRKQVSERVSGSRIFEEPETRPGGPMDRKGFHITCGQFYWTHSFPTASPAPRF